MARLTKIYTRTGDDGTTALGSGRRVLKSDMRVEAYGAVDELNAALGVVLASGCADDLRADLLRIQNELFNVGAELCVDAAELGKKTAVRIEQRHLAALETLIDGLNANLPPLANFVLPGGCLPAAQLQVARTICRRAERAVVGLMQSEHVPPQIATYLNRLSDALFVMARHQNRTAGVDEPIWNEHA